MQETCRAQSPQPVHKTTELLAPPSQGLLSGTESFFPDVLCSYFSWDFSLIFLFSMDQNGKKLLLDNMSVFQLI